MSKPWQRRPKESEEAYAAFLAYRDLGVNRSQEAAHKAHPESVPKNGTTKAWSATHKWVERCVAWDNHLQGKRDLVAAREVAKWELRRLKAVEEAWTLSDTLAEKLAKMLAWPMQTTKADKSGKTLIVPARWNYQTIALIAKTLTELRATALAATTRPLGEYTKLELQVTRDALDAAQAIHDEDRPGDPGVG